MGEFTLGIEKFSENFILGAEKAIRGASIKLFSAIILDSPVDTGRFRANWFATGSQPSVKVTTTTDTEGSKTVNDMTKKVATIKDWSAFTLTNNLPYSLKIEFGGYGDGPETTGGYSKQAPSGLVRVNISRFNAELELQAKGYLPK